MSHLDRKTAESEVFEEYLLFHQFRHDQTARLDFLAVRIVGWVGTGRPGAPAIYEHFPADEQNWSCTDAAEADVFLEAEIKFDGELNLEFPNAAVGGIQFGDVHEATGLGRLIQRMYAIAAERIPNADRAYFDSEFESVPAS